MVLEGTHDTTPYSTGEPRAVIRTPAFLILNMVIVKSTESVRRARNAEVYRPRLVSAPEDMQVTPRVEAFQTSA